MTDRFFSRYTPSLMKPEELEATFVQREDLAGRCIELVRESVLTNSKHHSLLIGPRGIGKTHLISLLYYRLKNLDDLRDKMLIAWMREEEWGVTGFLDLLIRIFRALKEEDRTSIEQDAGHCGAGILPASGSETQTTLGAGKMPVPQSSLADDVEGLYELSPEDAQAKAEQILKNYVGDRTLVLLIENMDDLFEGLGDDGQKDFRAYIQENPFISILATSQSLFGGVSRQDSPFYGSFHVEHLERLGLDDAVKMIGKIAEHYKDKELAEFVTTPKGRARIRAVGHLAGDNHRVYAIFSHFLTRKALDELVEPFMNMVDDMTPYYQARIATLPAQQRKIVEFLCDTARPAQVKEIAQLKLEDLNTNSVEQAMLQIEGTARSMGIEVLEG